MRDGSPGSYNAFWSCNEEAVCPRCQGIFIKRNVAQRYCVNCRHPTRLLITLEQSLVLQRFRNLCKKYHLPPVKTFGKVCHVHGSGIYFFTNLKLQENLSEERRKRWIQLLEKFCNDMENGHYSLIIRDARIEKREVPVKRQCPMTAANCAGGVLPGSCPKHWRECSLDGGAVRLTMSS